MATMNIKFNRPVLTDEAEEIEDALVKTLFDLGVPAEIYDEITGNRTVSDNFISKSRKKKFLVQISFTVTENDEFKSESAIEYFFQETGHIYFRGEKRNDENRTIHDFMIEGHAVNLGVFESPF